MIDKVKQGITDAYKQVAEKIAEFKRNPLGTAANLGKAGLGAAAKFFKRR